MIKPPGKPGLSIFLPKQPKRTPMTLARNPKFGPLTSQEPVVIYEAVEQSCGGLGSAHILVRGGGNAVNARAHRSHLCQRVILSEQSLVRMWCLSPTLNQRHISGYGTNCALHPDFVVSSTKAATAWATLTRPLRALSGFQARQPATGNRQ